MSFQGLFPVETVTIDITSTQELSGLQQSYHLAIRLFTASLEQLYNAMNVTLGNNNSINSSNINNNMDEYYIALSEVHVCYIAYIIKLYFINTKT
jgi:hypothetical protein